MLLPTPLRLRLRLASASRLTTGNSADRCSGNQRARLGIRGHGRRHVLVGDFHPRSQVVEHRIAEQVPPGPALQRVGGHGAHPLAPPFLERDRRFRLGPLIGRPHGTARQDKRQHEHGGFGRWEQVSHEGQDVFSSGLRLGVAPQLPLQRAAAAQLVQQQIDHRRGQQRDHLAGDQAADDGDAQRPAQFRAFAEADGQGQRAQAGGQRRHQDGPEAQQAGLAHRLIRRESARSLGVEREVDDQDGVLLDDADQQEQADQRDDGQLQPEDAAAPAPRPRPPRAAWTAR